MAKDMVTFLMPDGTEVSNDPGFGLEKALEESLASSEYRGDAGVPEAEQIAQTQTEHMATLNSGQPGVGEAAVPSDPHDYIPNTGTPAMARQVDDLAIAKEAGADLTETSVQDAEPVDSNKAVMKVREATAEQREAYAKAAKKLGEEGLGDPDTPKSEWSVAQLRMEVSARNADESRGEGDLIDISKAKKKSDLVKALEQDDERRAGGSA